VVNRVIRQAAAETAKAKANASATSEDMLGRGQVAALLELLRQAVARGRYVAVDATLHGLCGDQGVNVPGIRWASERLAEELVDPGPAAARVALAVASRPPEDPNNP